LVVIFYLFAQKPPWMDLLEIWYWGRSCQHNHLRQIFGDRLSWVKFVEGRKSVVPIDKAYHH